jgi:hypothetical protein
MSAEAKGLELYKDFVEQRLVKKSIDFHERIPKIHSKIFIIKEKKLSAQAMDLKSLKHDLTLFTRLFSVTQTRNLDLDKFFSHENQSCPPSLSVRGEMRTAKRKAELMEVLESIAPPIAPPTSCDAVVFDGAAVIHSRSPQHGKTFQGYFELDFKPHITREAVKVGATRMDIVWDLYHEESTKIITRSGRGSGTRRQVRPAGIQ